MKNIFHKPNGFTLIELMIAVGLFAIFITIVTGVFSGFVQVERQSIAQGQLISDTMSALESFIKESRTAYGTTYSPSGDGSSIAFRNQNDECVVYRKNDVGVMQRGAADISTDCNPDSLAENRFTSLTSKATEITDLAFRPVIANVSNGILENQGIVSITITAKSANDIQSRTPITIQNSITSRQMQPFVLPTPSP